jgi:predicted house-cleaning noncanonical NTP pyrophosphatase (MazG superfamily)
MQQFRINNDINAKLVVNDKILEDINAKMNNFSCTINDQLNYNKKLEAKIA